MEALSPAVLTWMAQQGLGAILAFAMFIIYRTDAKEHASKLQQSAQAWMEYGKAQGEMLTRVSTLLDRQSEVLEKIERHLSVRYFCPVSGVTANMLERGLLQPESLTVTQQRIVEALKDGIRHGDDE